MRTRIVAFLLGILLLQQFPHLPDGRWGWLLLLLLPLSVVSFRFVAVLWFVNGFLWALMHAHLLLGSPLATALEGEDLLLSGVIATIPEQRDRLWRFEFEVEQVLTPGVGRSQLPQRIRLNWYNRVPPLAVGERWQLLVRLKQPHGFMNPGGFDYEGWLYRHGIRATGYVRDQGENHKTGEAGLGYQVDRWRALISAKIDEALPDAPFRGIIKALAIGKQDEISQPQWTTFLKTGTNHLVAISGLHVSMVSGLAFFLWRWLWGCSAWLTLRWPAQKAGAVAAIMAALVYAALAGFSIPTQRTLIMVVVFMVALILQRYRRPSDGLLLALLLVLLFDPLAVMDAGFWLSFGAVAFIFFGMGGRLASRGVWWKWGRIHLLMAVALAPATLLLFQKASLISPLANFVAVPWVSLLVVPLVLLGSLLLLLIPAVGAWLLVLANGCLALLWPLLNGFAELPMAQIYHAFVGGWVVIPATIGVVWLLAPKGWPARWLGGVWLATAFLLPQTRPAAGEFWFTLLDVGQGLAAVVETEHHLLIFDTGPRFSDTFDTGEVVLLPYLLQRGVAQVDTLVVSHGDNDHIGGAESLLASFPVKQLLTSAAEKLPQQLSEPCRSGQQWRWDGVDFLMLNPTNELQRKGNNNSCVLKVSAATGSLLLTGDIEKGAERALLSRHGSGLRADLLVVPHHGSKTSSTEAFITAVSPRWALFPVGYRNRFNFPRPEVVERYQAHNIELLDSAQMGAISVRFEGKGISIPEGYRETAQHYWTHRP